MTTTDEIKQRLDIVEVISSYVPLQKAGRNFKANCPFHVEKTPSFYVFPERQTWHCFGACGSGGDIFSFVMKRENVGFGEALHLLADRAGISIDIDSRGIQKKQEGKRLQEINNQAAQFYHELLLHSPQAELARTYLDKRGISLASIEVFQLGYSPNRWDETSLYLEKIGYTEQDTINAGLAIQKEAGGSYDRFRNRLMFPIRNISGVVVGFGARALDDSNPKYLNSPQTEVFDKSSIFYGIDRAKESIRKHDLVVIVEGYMDVIAVHQYGFQNTVASMGTSLTEKQVSSLKKLTKNLAFALDADTAGETATQRGIDLTTTVLDQKVVPVITSQGKVEYEHALDAELKVILLPTSKDPDEIVRDNPETWHSLVETALSVVDYTFESVASTLDLSKPEGKTAAVNRLQPVIERIKDPIQRAHYIGELAQLVGIDQRLLVQAFGPRRQKKALPERAKTTFSLPSADSWEEYCLRLLLHHPVLHVHASRLSSDYFERSEYREIFLAWIANPNLSQLQNSLNTALSDHLDRLINCEFPHLSDEKADKALDDCVIRMQQRWLKAMKATEATLLSQSPGEIDMNTEQYQSMGVIRTNSELRKVFTQNKQPNERE
ncbi:MAG: DNA primase [Chloroflexota bacterium]|nr:DNA primase [Chloroflexota bacterium]